VVENAADKIVAVKNVIVRRGINAALGIH